MRDVIVIGGGIAGLSCALRLRAAGLDALLLEAQTTAGGNIQTSEIDGFRFERGPHTFMPSADDIFALAAEAGISDQIVASSPAAHRRFIVRNGRLHLVPTGPWSFVTSDLISLRGKLRLMSEPFRTGERGALTDSATTFFARRFGDEGARVLAGAFISGVYAGDPATLSAPAAFPLFWRFEQERGSMIRGAMAHGKQRKRQREELAKKAGQALAPRPSGLCTFARGLGQLTSTLALRLGDRCRTGVAVRGVERSNGTFAVSVEGEVLPAQRVVVATPPGAAAQILRSTDAALADLVTGIPLAPMTVVHLGFRQRQPGVPDGFGFLAPRNEGVRSLGILFPSRLFSERAPAAGELLTGFVGGMTDTQALALEDVEIERIVRDDLKQLCGVDAAPDFVRVLRYQGAIPQFVLGHLDRMEQIRGRLATLPGLHLAGNYLRGVGMKDAVASGFETAAAIVEQRASAGRPS